MTEDPYPKGRWLYAIPFLAAGISLLYPYTYTTYLLTSAYYPEPGHYFIFTDSERLDPDLWRIGWTRTIGASVIIFFIALVLIFLGLKYRSAILKPRGRWPAIVIATFFAFVIPIRNPIAGLSSSISVGDDRAIGVPYFIICAITLLGVSAAGFVFLRATLRQESMHWLFPTLILGLIFLTSPLAMVGIGELLPKSLLIESPAASLTAAYLTRLSFPIAAAVTFLIYRVLQTEKAELSG